MKPLALLALWVSALTFTATCHAGTPSTGSGQGELSVRLFAPPAPLTPRLHLELAPPMAPPVIPSATTQMVMVEARGSGGAARFAGAAFEEAGYAAASGDGLGFGFWMVVGGVGLLVAIVLLIAETDAEDDVAKRAPSRPGMLTFRF